MLPCNVCNDLLYDTQKFNLHHGSFSGAKRDADWCMNDLNIGVHDERHLGLLWRFYLWEKI
jgi:hypothetical protein